MLAQDGVEVCVVAGFLVVHVLHEGPEVRVCPHDDGVLGGVDEDGGEFAGLVYAQGGGEEGALGGGEGADGFGFLGGGIFGDLGGGGRDGRFGVRWLYGCALEASSTLA